MNLIVAQVLLAAEAGTLDLTILGQFGAVGLIAAIGIVFAKGAHQRERDRADRMEEENRRLNTLLLDRVIPALISATRAAEESAELLSAIQREREIAHLAGKPPRAPKGDD